MHGSRSCSARFLHKGFNFNQGFLVCLVFADDLNSLGSEDSRARSPSPPPLQPYDECPTPTPHLPPYAPPSLGPPPLTPSLLEEESPTIDWHPHHISPPRSPPGLSVIKQPSELALSKSELVEIRRHNLNIRSLAYREVRRPGISEYRILFCLNKSSFSNLSDNHGFVKLCELTFIVHASVNSCLLLHNIL